MQRDARAVRALFAQTAQVMGELREQVRTTERLQERARALRQELKAAAEAEVYRCRQAMRWPGYRHPGPAGA